MSLTEHAEYELKRAGWTTPDGDLNYEGKVLLDTVATFSEGGWSGGSAPFGIHIVERLLRFEPLGPLTDNPDEWMHVAEEVCGERSLWQSRRKATCFSHDGGKTYRDMADRKPHGDERWRRWGAYLIVKIARTCGLDGFTLDLERIMYRGPGAPRFLLGLGEGLPLAVRGGTDGLPVHKSEPADLPQLPLVAFPEEASE